MTGGGVTNTDNALWGGPGKITVTVPGANVDSDFTVTQTILNTQASFPAPPDLAAPPILSFFRQQAFIDDVSASNPDGFTITGFGLGLASGTGSVSIINNGTITSALGTNALDLTSLLGAVTYGGTGDVTTIGLGQSAIVSLSFGDTTISTGGGTISAANGRAIDATSLTGTVSVTTGGTVTGSTDAISAVTALGGGINVNIDGGTVTGQGGRGIVTLAGTGATTIAVNNGSTVIGSTDAIVATSPTTGNVNVGISGTVTGQAGSGVLTSAGSGTTTINTNTAGTTVTGTGAGTSAISAGNASGATSITVGAGAVVTDTLGRAVTSLAAGTGTTSIANSGTLVGAGTVANPVILTANASGNVTITNNGPGLIANNATPTLAANNAIAISTLTPAATGATTVNNAGTLIGTVTLAAGANGFTNLGGGQWIVSDNAGSSAAFGGGLTNALNNNQNATVFTGTTAAGSVANFTGLKTIANAGTFNAGNSTTSVTNLNPNAGTAQATTNAGTINVNGTLNFANFGTHAAGSSFVNGSNVPTVIGTIDMSRFPASVAPDGTAFAASSHAITDKVTLGLNAAAGTSDLNFTYVFGPAYNFDGAHLPAKNSILNVDTLIYAPGSASDRLIISGAATGKTAINIWDTNPNPAAYNPRGITVVAVNGASANSFFINGQTNPQHQSAGNFTFDLYEPAMGPMGAIKKQFFFYPLLQDTSLNSVQGMAAGGSRYALFSLPDIEAYQLPIAITAAQNIFYETALGWLDHQDEVRNWQRSGWSRLASASGGGADLPAKGAPAVGEAPGPGVWAKAIGSWADRRATERVGDLVPAAIPVGAFDLSYQQTTVGLIGGVDGGASAIFTAYDAVIVGLMGGYVDSTLNFKSSPTSFGFSGATTGASLSYLNGGWFAQAMFKADFLDLSLRFPSLAVFGVPNQTIHTTNLGGIGNFGYRFEFRPWYVEPVVTVDYVQTRIGGYTVPGMFANFHNGEMFRGGAGARFGAVWRTDGQYEVESSITAKGWDVFSAKESVTLVTAGPDVTLSDHFTKAFADVSSQLNVINKGTGWSAFVGGGVKYNKDLTVANGRGGVRYQF